MAARSSQDINWVDLVLESYVIRSKLLNLLMEKAKRENLNVSEADFNIQVCKIADQTHTPVLMTCIVLRR